MEPDKYIKDIETIKSLLIKQRKTPLIESWAFYLWAALIFCASIVHFVLFKTVEIENTVLVFSIWMPTFLAGIAGETAGWLRSRKKHSIYLFSEANLSMIFALIILSLFGFLIFAILKSLGALNFLPYVLAGLICIAFGFVGAILASAFYYVSIILICIVTALFFIPVEGSIAAFICGILVSSAMLSAGLINSFVLKGRRHVS